MKTGVETIPDTLCLPNILPQALDNVQHNGDMKKFLAVRKHQGSLFRWNITALPRKVIHHALLVHRHCALRDQSLSFHIRSWRWKDDYLQSCGTSCYLVRNIPDTFNFGSGDENTFSKKPSRASRRCALSFCSLNKRHSVPGRITSTHSRPYCSPNLARSDYFLFPKLNGELSEEYRLLRCGAV